MIGFFLAAAALLVAALYFILPPLIGRRLYRGEVSHGETNLSIYRDQLRELDNDLANGTLDRHQHETARREIERRVLEEGSDETGTPAQAVPMWTLAIIIAIAVPLTTIGLYLGLGSPVALDATRTAAPAGDGHELTPERIAKMVDSLKERLRANPDDVEGWVMLAKTSQAIDRHEDAVKAYREIVRRVRPDAQLFADFADALAVAQGRSLDGEPQQLIAQALKVDPANVKALALAGTSAFNRKDYIGAVQYWRRILGIVPPDSEFAQRIQAGISEAESLSGTPVPIAKPVARSDAKPPVGAGVRIRGRVELDSAVAKSVSPGDTVFVFARAAEGPKMPLAVLRLAVKDLPKDFELNEAMAMAPGMSISNFADLVVGARVSKSGGATPQPGDWESVLVPARPGASGLSVVVSRLVR